MSRILKKTSSLLASSLVVLVLSGFFSLRPAVSPSIVEAHLIDTSVESGGDGKPCIDITGTTASVSSPSRTGRTGGVEDPGNMKFDINPPAEDFQACMEAEEVLFPREDVTQVTADAPGATEIEGHFVKGWTWNPNLGYVSFFCQDGLNKASGDASAGGGECGSMNYAVVTNPNEMVPEDPRDAAGEPIPGEPLPVRGFAWGDNIGWISMGCDDGLNLGARCGEAGTNFSTFIATEDMADTGIASCGAVEKGGLFGYAWANSVGWINFCGAKIRLGNAVPPPIFDPKIIVDPEDPLDPDEPGDTGPGSGDDGPIVSPEGEKIYANGSDGYKIVIRVRNAAGDIMTRADVEAAGVTIGENFRVENLDFTNRVRADQVTKCNPPDGTATTLPACEYNGAILPTPDDFAWSDEDNGLMARVTSLAPTDFEGDNNPLNDSDILQLKGIEVNWRGSTNPLEVDAPMPFLPVVNVTKVQSENGKNTVSAVRGSSEILTLVAEAVSGKRGTAVPAENSSIKLAAQLHDCASNYYFMFDEGELGVTTAAEDDEGEETMEANNYNSVFVPNSNPNLDRTTAACNAASGIPATAKTLADTIEDIGFDDPAPDDRPDSTIKTLLVYANLKPDRSVPSEVISPNQVGFLARVKYTAAGPAGSVLVHYFSLIVPDSSLLNQAAHVSGNVRVDIQNILRSDVVAQTLRNDGRDTQSKREMFYRTIRKNKKPAATAASGASDGALEISGAPLDAIPPSALQELSQYNRLNLGSGDRPCRIVIGDDTAADGSALTFPKDTTIISEGCDIFIDQNIYQSQGRLGILAFEDLKMTGARKGGNVYICNRVTDLELNLVTDGSVLPYGESETTCGDKNSAEIIHADGLPNIEPAPSSMPWRDRAKRQLTILGSILSNNTYGGAFQSPPILGDGTEVRESDQIRKARIFDINFLRYAFTRDADPAVDVGREEGSTCWATEDPALTDEIALSSLLGEKTCNNNNPDKKGAVNILYRAPSTTMPIFNAAVKGR